MRGKSRFDRREHALSTAGGVAPAASSALSLDGYGAKLAVVLLAALVVYNTGFDYIGAQTFRIGNAVYHTTFDDVMITLRVASNIAAGHGPYFNPGEAVAANTSLFWPFVVAIPRLFLGLSQSVIALCVVSLLLTVLTVAAVALAARTLAAAALSAAVTVTSPAISYYAWTGWEHIPQMLFVTAAFLVLMGRLPAVQEEGARLRACVLLLAAAFLMRPDALMLLAVPSLVLLYRFWRERDSRDLAALAVAGALCAFYYLAHLYFYHSLVPNTYYLRLGREGETLRLGLSYLMGNIGDGGNTTLILLAIGCLFLRRAAPSADVIVGASISLFLLAIVAIGGDYFSRGRFLLCVTPIAVFVVFDCLWDAAGTALAKIAKASVLLALVVLVPLHSGWRDLVIRSDEVMQNPLVQRARLPVKQISGQLAMLPLIRKAITPADGRIGLFFLGTLSYYMPDYDFADFLGKADPVIATGPSKWGPIAHNKWDIEHTLTTHRVAIVPLEPISRRQAEEALARRRDHAAGAGLVASRLTQSEYRYLPAQALGLDREMGLWVRNDLVPRFTAAIPQ